MIIMIIIKSLSTGSCDFKSVYWASKSKYNVNVIITIHICQYIYFKQRRKLQLYMLFKTVTDKYTYYRLQLQYYLLQCL